MFLLTSEEMRRLDDLSIRRDRVPSFKLMSEAGQAVFKVIQKQFSPLMKKNIIILCGPGNNGGDGLVAARHLLKAGANVSIFLFDNNLKGDSKKAQLSLGKRKSVCVYFRSLGEVKACHRRMGKISLVVDALFGTGLSRPLGGMYGEVIRWVNSLPVKRLSIDIPSGLCADTGKIPGASFRADCTVTLGFPKRGFFFNEGPEQAGQIHVAPLSFSHKALEKIQSETSLITRQAVLPLLEPRPRTGHKGSFGHVFVIGCSRQKLGAGVLACHASLSAGAGLSTLVLPSGAYGHIPRSALEVMYEPVGEEDYFRLRDTRIVLERIKKATVVALGPGLGLHPDTVRFVHHLVEHCPQPLVLDADALNAVAHKPSVLKKKKNVTLLTPHPAEMARLVGTTTSYVQKNRLKVARDFAVKFKVILLLKGYRSLVAFPDGRVWVNPTGNSAMASAGQGDVLTGIYAGLLSQFLSGNTQEPNGWPRWGAPNERQQRAAPLAELAALGAPVVLRRRVMPSIGGDRGQDPFGYRVSPFLFGCFLHGLVGDLLARKGQRVVLAGDIIDNLSLGYRFLKKKGDLLSTIFY